MTNDDLGRHVPDVAEDDEVPPPGRFRTAAARASEAARTAAGPLAEAARTPESKAIAALAIATSALLGNPAYALTEVFFGLIPEPSSMALVHAAGQALVGAAGIALAAAALGPHENAATWTRPVSGAAVLAGVAALAVAAIAVVAGLGALLAS